MMNTKTATLPTTHTYTPRINLKKVSVLASVALASLMLLPLGGCARVNTDNVAFEPSVDYVSLMEDYDNQVAQQASRTASLWANNEYKSDLFADYKGRQVGDLITVIISESSSATNTGSATTGKTSSVGASATALGGLPLDLGVTNFLGTGVGFSPNLGTQYTSSFAGQGSNTRQDQIQATIAATVLRVLPSGNLVIEGHREIVVDNEKQIMSIRGLIRPKDINANNVVASQNIANAQISYSGKGMISDTRNTGLFSKVVDWLWPFS